MTDDVLLLDKTDGVATITLNQPGTLNALGYEMLAGLGQAVADVAADGRVRAVVLTGAGRGFCSGANLLGGSGETLAAGGWGVRVAIERMNDLLARIVEMEKPWLAAVNGPAVGGGCSLALACDLVLIAESAYLGLGYVNVGMALDMGSTYLLPRLVGLRRAKELAFFGERVPAARAVELGLANRAVPDADLPDQARQWAARLAAGPTLAIGATKLGMQRGLHASLRDTLHWEAMMVALLFQSADAAEGLTAFYQKRKPTFEGH